MNYLALRERPAQFLALTSLLPAEFDELLTDFAPRWERYHRFHTLDGDRRRFPVHQERANATLAGTDTKLFFLLVYLKTNALQQHQAASFGVSQTRVSRLAGPLLSVLNQTLAARHLLPVRDGAQLAQRLAAHPDKVFTCDGVERGIKRLRMIRDTLRLRGDWFRDTVMLVACGLHNLRDAAPTGPASCGAHANLDK